MNFNEYQIYSFVLEIMYLLKNSDTLNDISQLPLILDRENFFRLLNYFGGMTIKIPTKKEFNFYLKVLIYYKFIKIDKHTKNWSLQKLKVDKKYKDLFDKKVYEINQELKALNIKYNDDKLNRDISVINESIIDKFNNITEELNKHTNKEVKNIKSMKNQKSKKLKKHINKISNKINKENNNLYDL